MPKNSFLTHQEKLVQENLIQLLLELVLKEELVDAYQLNTIQKFPEKYFDFPFSVKLKVLYLKSRSE